MLNDAVADTALTLALMITRRALEAERIVSRGGWPHMPWEPMVRERAQSAAHTQTLTGLALQGKTIGFIGFGGSAYLPALCTDSFASRTDACDAAPDIPTGPRRLPRIAPEAV